MPVDSFLDSIRAVLSLFVGMGLIVRVERLARGTRPTGIRRGGSWRGLLEQVGLPVEDRQAVRGLGHAPERPPQFDGIEALPKRVQGMAADVQLVKDYIARHCDA